MSGGEWVHCAAPRGAAARFRLFCFPYAGGGATVFRNWSNHLDADVEVCAIRLPGRETRIAEKPFSEMAALLPPLAEAVTPWLDRPHAFYGHSMGALVAFELIRHLRRQSQRLPVRLFASARRAPQLPGRESPCHDLPEAEFIDCLVGRYGGIPSAVLAERELLRLFLPMLRADLKLFETYRHVTEPSLELPLTVFGGLQDPMATPEELRAWREMTRGEFHIHLLAGGHFFLQSSEAEVLRILAGELGLRSSGQGGDGVARASEGDPP